MKVKMKNEEGDDEGGDKKDGDDDEENEDKDEGIKMRMMRRLG